MVQEFKVDQQFKTLVKCVCLMFLVLGIGGLALPFLPGPVGKNPHGPFMASLISTLVCGGILIWGWKTLKTLPFRDISADEDGLWPGHRRKKEGLVPWGRIHRVRERMYLQCLDLLDADGRRLLRVEYQLKEFECLRRLINDQVGLPPGNRHGSRFAKKKVYHLFYAGFVLGGAWLGIHVGRTTNPLLGYGAMGLVLIAVIWEYLTTVSRLEIRETYLVIGFPFSQKQVLYPDITAIEMGDTFNKGSRHPEVWVTVEKRKRPYKFKQLGVDANILLAVLKAAAGPL